MLDSGREPPGTEHAPLSGSMLGFWTPKHSGNVFCSMLGRDWHMISLLLWEGRSKDHWDYRDWLCICCLYRSSLSRERCSEKSLHLFLGYFSLWVASLTLEEKIWISVHIWFLLRQQGFSLKKLYICPSRKLLLLSILLRWKETPNTCTSFIS